MLRIILGAFASLLIINSAFALPAEVDRINPTELSERQKEIAIKFDQTSGFVGKFFWVRTDDTFSYIPVVSLAKENSVKRIEVIKETVINTIVKEVLVPQIITEVQERIVVNTDKIDELNLEISELKGKLDLAKELNDTIPGLNDTIAGLEEDLRKAEITVGRYHAEQLKTIRIVANLRNDLKAANLTIDTMRAVSDITTSIPTVDTPDLSVSISNDKDILKGHVATATSIHVFGTSVTVLTDSGDPDWPNIDTFNLSNQSDINTFTFMINDMIVSSWAAGVEAGFNAGFDAGYQEGYADGYADGFKAGVNSVK